MKMNVLNKIMALVIIVLLASCQEKQETKVFTEADIAIIPKPVSLQLGNGVFEFNDQTHFVISDPSQKEIISTLSDKFKSAAGWTLGISEKAPKTNFIEFIVDENLNDEAYELVVSSDKITIKDRKSVV